MLDSLRKFRQCDAGATGFENGLLALLAITSIIVLLGQVEGSIRDTFRNTAIQADTDRQLNNR